MLSAICYHLLPSWIPILPWRRQEVDMTREIRHSQRINHRGFAFFLFKLTKLHFYFTHQIGEISYWVYIISKTTAEPWQSKYSNESDVFWDLTKHSGYRILWYHQFFVLLIQVPSISPILMSTRRLLSPIVCPKNSGWPGRRHFLPE